MRGGGSGAGRDAAEAGENRFVDYVFDELEMGFSVEVFERKYGDYVRPGLGGGGGCVFHIIKFDVCGGKPGGGEGKN